MNRQSTTDDEALQFSVSCICVGLFLLGAFIVLRFGFEWAVLYAAILCVSFGAYGLSEWWKR
jgi:hypothetical protein